MAKPITAASINPQPTAGAGNLPWRKRLEGALWSLLLRLPAGVPADRLLPEKSGRRLREMQLIKHSGLFDPDWYGRRCPEAELRCWTPIQHYLLLGAPDGLDPGPAFSTSGYSLLYEDVVASGMNPLAHYAALGAAPGRRRRLMLTGREPLLRVCCLVHLFYPELWHELSLYLGSLAGIRFDLKINIPEPAYTVGLEQAIRRRFPDAAVMVSPNRGRDIGGFFRLLEDAAFDAFDVFILLHTKKSPHRPSPRADAWRRALLNALLGTPDIARENLALLAAEPRIGCLAAARCRDTKLGGNAANYRHLMDRLGVRPADRACEFVRGTMFMARTSVIRRLFERLHDLPFEPGDDRPLAFHMDGQLAHAVERVIGGIVRAEGLRMAWRPAPTRLLPAELPG
jgi:hypothetical protein